MVGPPSRPHKPIVVINMTDYDIVKRVADLIGINYICRHQRPNKKYKPEYSVRITGSGAVGLMETVYVLMGKRRKSQIRKAIDSYDVHNNLSKMLRKEE